MQIEQSDIITFHVYDWPEVLESRIKQLQPYGRPIVVTEYLARGAGSTFDTSLPIAREVPRGHDQLGIRGSGRRRRASPGIPGRSRTPAMDPRFGITTSSMPTAGRTGRRKSTSCAR